MRSREWRIGLAYAAAGSAKIIGALVQLAVLPIAAYALGATSLGLLFTVAALASFPLIAMAGFSPAAAVLMSKAQGSGEHKITGSYFWSLLFWSFVVGAVLTAATYLALAVFQLPSHDEPALLFALLTFLMLNYLTSQIDGARAAFQQSHASSGFAVAGSVGTLLLAVTAGTMESGVAEFFFIIYIIPMIAQLLNLAAFACEHRKTLGAPRIDAKVGPEILKMLSDNVQAQSGMVLYLHGTVYLLAYSFGTAAVAVIGAFVRIAVLVHSMLLAFHTPVLPTISEATAKNDLRWIRKALQSIFLVAAVILLAQALVTAVFGRWLSVQILDMSIDHQPSFFLSLAAFLFTYSMTHLLFLAKLATATPHKRGLKILSAAIVGIVIGQLFAGDNIALYLAIQTVNMAMIAMVVYAGELLVIARKPKSE